MLPTNKAERAWKLQKQRSNTVVRNKRSISPCAQTTMMYLSAWERNPPQGYFLKKIKRGMCVGVWVCGCMVGGGGGVCGREGEGEERGEEGWWWWGGRKEGGGRRGVKSVFLSLGIRGSDNCHRGHRNQACMCVARMWKFVVSVNHAPGN